MGSTFVVGSPVPIEGTIVFSKTNLLRVTRPHEDALILTLSVVEYDVCRILIDQGSFADLLHIFAYKQMNFSMNALESPERALTGFNNSTTIFLDDIVFPISAGPLTMMVKFSVVEDPSLYNAILGKAQTHDMKVIPSTYHQKESYLMTQRQIDIYGDQMTSGQCYQVTMFPTLGTYEREMGHKGKKKIATIKGLPPGIR